MTTSAVAFGPVSAEAPALGDCSVTCASAPPTADLSSATTATAALRGIKWKPNQRQNERGTRASSFPSGRHVRMTSVPLSSSFPERAAENSARAPICPASFSLRHGANGSLHITPGSRAPAGLRRSLPAPRCERLAQRVDKLLPSHLRTGWGQTRAREREGPRGAASGPFCCCLSARVPAASAPSAPCGPSRRGAS